MTNLPSILYVSEVAEILRCSRWKVYDMINRGELPAIRIGTKFRVKRDTLFAWMKAQEQERAA